MRQRSPAGPTTPDAATPGDDHSAARSLGHRGLVVNAEPASGRETDEHHAGPPRRTSDHSRPTGSARSCRQRPGRMRFLRRAPVRAAFGPSAVMGTAGMERRLLGSRHRSVTAPAPPRREAAAGMLLRSAAALNAGPGTAGPRGSSRPGGPLGPQLRPKTASRPCDSGEPWSFSLSISTWFSVFCWSSALRMMSGVMNTSRVDVVSWLVSFLNR